MLIVHKDHCQGFWGSISLHGILFLVQQLQVNIYYLVVGKRLFSVSKLLYLILSGISIILLFYITYERVNYKK